MELLIAGSRAEAIKHAARQGWTEQGRGNGGLVWDRGGGVLVRYVGTPEGLQRWPRGTALHEVPGASGSDAWAEAKRLVQLGRLSLY